MSDRTRQPGAFDYEHFRKCIAGPTAETILYLESRLEKLRPIARDAEEFERLCAEAKRRAITTRLTLSDAVTSLIVEARDLGAFTEALRHGVES